MPRDAILHDDFLAAQPELGLVEVRPDGTALRLRYTVRGDPSADWFNRAVDVPAARCIVSEEAKHLVAEEAYEQNSSLIVLVATDTTF